MKKVVSILVAVLVVFSMFAVTASAANAPTITAAANVSSAKVGDTVTVTVSTSKNSKLCAVTLSVFYKTDYFQVVDATDAGAFSSAELNKDLKGEVRFVGAVSSNIADNETTLFTVKLKVLKTGGTITFKATEAYVAEGSGEVDVTAKIADKTITVACPHANKEDKVTKAPTCTAAGEKTTTCKDCGAALGKAAVPAAGHKFAEATVTKQPTCTEKGEKTGVCTVCKAETKQEIPAKGHDFEKPTVTKEPTCTETGLKEGKCKDCGQVAKEVIPVADHKYGAWKEVTPAQVGKDGVKERTCEVCGKVDKGVIDKLPAPSKPSNPSTPSTPSTPSKPSTPSTGNDGSANIPNTSASITWAFAAAGLALATGTVVRRKRK